MFESLVNVVSSCTTSCVASAVAGVVLLYYLYSWIFAPKLHDSYFPINEKYLSDLKFVGKHSSKIELDDIAPCISEMRKVFKSNITRRTSNRKKELKNLLNLVKENADKIEAALKADLGRPDFLASAYEVIPLIGELKKFIKKVDKWSAPRPMGFSLTTFPSTDYHAVEPYGTVFVNGIWNFPFACGLSPIAGALAAGNNVVFKPCNTSPESSKLMADLLHKYMDHRFVQVIGHLDIANGDDRVVTHSILQNPFDMVFFTGSSNGGKYIMKEASKFLTPVVLELGGKNAVIIDDTADLEVAAKQVLNARVVNCGQQCISPDYVLCYENSVEKFTEICLKWCKKWYKIGDELNSDLGIVQSKLVSDQQVKRVTDMLSSTKGKILFGGKCDEKTRCFEPTVVLLDNIKNIENEETMKYETFGPILWIVPINNSVKEAVEYINSRDKSLSLYMFSKNKENQNYVIHNTSSGGVQVNGTITYAGHDYSRFGGVGKSGIGAYHGKHSFETFSHLKPVVISWFEMPLVYPPYDSWKKTLLSYAM